MHDSYHDSIYVTVRRINQSWRVMATTRDAEHTHGQAFYDRSDAWDLAKEIRRGLAGGYDLNLRFWSSIER